MKTLITIWCVTFLLYSISSAVQADSIPLKNTTVWTGYNVVGDLCVDIKNKHNDAPANAELWLITQENVQRFAAVKGYKCLDIKLSKTTTLQAITYEESSEVSVVKDTTSTFFVVELPI